MLDILDGMGYHTVREAGRKIIRSQAETGGNAVPWADTARYARLMSLQSRNDFEKHADLGEPCFFDRGIVDVWGYCQLIGLPVFRELKNAAEKWSIQRKGFPLPLLGRNLCQRLRKETEPGRSPRDLPNPEGHL